VLSGLHSHHRILHLAYLLLLQQLEAADEEYGVVAAASSTNYSNKAI